MASTPVTPAPQRGKVYRLVDVPIVVTTRATATGVPVILVDVSQCQNIGVQIITEANSGNASGTVLCRGSMVASNAIDMTAAASFTNPWDYVAMFDLDLQAITPGSTGVVFSSSNEVMNLELSTSTIRTIAFELANVTAGKFTITVYAVNNQ